MQPAPEGGEAPERGPSEPLSAPSPVTRLTLSNNLRRSIAESARAEGDDNRLWESAGSLASIHHQYSGSEKPASAFEIDLHDLWFTYYHAAKNTTAQNPMLDRLVVQIMQARELGALRRPCAAADASVTTEATTSDGIIWTDLPFLVPDMTGFWLQDWPMMSASNLVSFVTFLAKLASVGVCQDRLGGIGLALLCDALETPRPLGASGEEHAEDETRRPEDVTVAALLPAVNAWLFHAGHKTVQLADARWTSDAGSLGELFRGDALCGTATRAGFSPERWVFWLKRLEQVAEGAESAGDARLGQTVRRMMDNMLFVADERHSAVRQLLRDSPGVIRYEPVMQVLGPK
ncbi:hypothetical protein A9K55_002156 [Cordyceps militaris]|uniref:Uncharacterized protein n=1 Tax=Cordyceps militaris TaxID=73501 RepID=A0A2H4SS78_CORMI|nr:hypothetical protein A9K55_002156 [Cordyceps militaris]